MKSTELIDSKISSPNFEPKQYDYANWFISQLLDLGFYWECDEKPHFKVRSGDIIVTISPYVNIVIVDELKRGYVIELYCHPTIPQTAEEFNAFWKNIKKLI